MMSLLGAKHPTRSLMAYKDLMQVAKVQETCKSPRSKRHYKQSSKLEPHLLKAWC